MRKYKDLEAYFKGEDIYREGKGKEIPKAKELKEFSIPCVFKHDFFYAKELNNPFQFIDEGSLRFLLQNTDYLYLGDMSDTWYIYGDGNKKGFFIGQNGYVLGIGDDLFLSSLDRSGIIKYIYKEIKKKTKKELLSIVINKVGTKYNKIWVGYSLTGNDCLRAFICIG